MSPDDTPEPPEWSMPDHAWDDHNAPPHTDDDAPPPDPWDPWDDTEARLVADLPAPKTYTGPVPVPDLPDDDGEDHTSWWPVNLTSLFACDHQPPKPELFARDDGQPLLYAGKCHAFNGESESGKTWAALIACVQTIRAGHHILYLDFEDTADTVVTRLLALGAKPAQVLELFHYVQPHEPIVVRGGKYTPGNADLAETMDRYPVALAVIDGITEAMTMHGLKLEDNADYATFHGALPRRLSLTGAAVVQIDHVTKDRENRGRWAIGAQHKLAAMDGAVFSFQIKAPFGLGRDGMCAMSIEKDRPGQLRQHAKGKRIADLHLDSHTETHALSWRLDVPESGDSSGETVTPSRYMERVSRFLEDKPQGMSKNSIRAGVTGGNDMIDLALDLLANNYVRTEREGQRVLHFSVKPFREGMAA